MPRIFVTRRIPQPGLDSLAEAGMSVEIGQEVEAKGLSREVLLAGVGRCDVLLSLLTERVDREVLEANPGLRGVANMAVGYENVDVAVAAELGIPVSNTPGVLTETTADLTWALLMAVARGVVPADAYMRGGEYRLWGPNLFCGADVGVGCDGRRRVLGLVGYGRIGAAVARRAVGFDMEVIACSPSRRAPDGKGVVVPEWVGLGELLARSDFVSLHVPGGAGTTGLIGEAELLAMREDAYLINTSRGPVVDEPALVRALQEDWIAGAGLDVYEDEPRMADGLAACPNAVLLPHVGSATVGTRGAMARCAVRNAVAMARGDVVPDRVG